jgi:molecular chaperone GrpE
MSRKKHPQPQSPQSAESPPQEQAQQQQSNGELAQVRQERDDLLGRLQRVSADFVNYQKRAQRDMAQAREFANEELIKSLLGVLDDMDRALEAARAKHSVDEPLLRGMMLIHGKAMDALKRFGLEVIAAEGQPFDPDQHSAIFQESSDRHPPQTVLREMQKGYRFKGRMLRPTAVVVSKHPETKESPQPAPAGQEADNPADAQVEGKTDQTDTNGDR